MSVRVYSGINNSAEQIIHYERQRVGVQQPMQTPHEHSRVRIQAGTRSVHGVGVGEDPGDHLHLLVPHSRGGHLIVVVAALRGVLRAGAQQQLGALLGVENEVRVPLRGVSVVLAVLSRPLHFEVSEGFEGVKQRLLCDVPRDPAQEHLGAVHGVPVAARGKLAGPGADDLWQFHVLLGVQLLHLLPREEGAGFVRLVEVVGHERRIGGWVCRVGHAVVGGGGGVAHLRHLEALVYRVYEEGTWAGRGGLGWQVLRPETGLLLLRMAQPV